jgi:hypothetical protein
LKEWWNRKKDNTKKSKESSDNYTFIDFIFDVLFWLPELVLLPFRIIFWLLRGTGRLVWSLFDIA